MVSDSGALLIGFGDSGALHPGALLSSFANLGIDEAGFFNVGALLSGVANLGIDLAGALDIGTLPRLLYPANLLLEKLSPVPWTHRRAERSNLSCPP